MFIAKKADVKNHSIDEKSLYLAKIELPFVTPLFLCEVHESEIGDNESACSTPHLISDIEGLHNFVVTNKILNTYLLSPGYMNQSSNWSINRLMGISRAEYFIDDCSSYIYRFEIEQGQTIYQDLSGLNVNKDALMFECIIRLDELQAPT